MVAVLNVDWQDGGAGKRVNLGRDLISYLRRQCGVASVARGGKGTHRDNEPRKGPCHVNNTCGFIYVTGEIITFLTIVNVRGGNLFKAGTVLAQLGHAVILMLYYIKRISMDINIILY